MDMNGVISSLLEHPGWGLLVIIVLVVIISIINNPSIVSEISKLVDRLSKSKKVIEYGHYTLFKLTRTQPRTWILVARLITTVFSAFMLTIFGLLEHLIIISPSLGQNAGVQLLLAFSFLFPVIILIDVYAPPVNSSVSLELDGDLKTLLRFCQKMLFDIGAPITKFDTEAGEINARLYGNEISIKVERLENSHNQFTLNYNSRFISNLFYSAEYRRNINNLVRSLCYPDVNSLERTNLHHS
jgi:hypothetical protein